MRDSTNSRAIKEEEASGILSTFRFNIGLSKIPLLGGILF